MATRSAIRGGQITAATVVPEFDFSTISQATLDGYGRNADITSTIIPYSQFQAETGVASPHPLSNLGQDKVLKVEISTATTVGIHIINIVNIAAINISRGAAGCFMFNPDRSLTGAIGPIIFWANDAGLLNYRRFAPTNYSDPPQNEWQFCGGLDDNNYDSNFVDGGSYDATAIDYIRHTIDTDGNDPTFYITSQFYGAVRKPVFMIEQDDLNVDTDIFIEDVEAYGFKGGMNAISINVDLAGRPTTANMKTYLDNGHAVYSHGAVDYVTLGLAGSQAQINSELAFWRAFYPPVLTDEMLLHHALPEGKTTKDVREWMKSQGFKTMRNVGATNPIFGLIGQPEYGDCTYSSLPSMGVDLVTPANFVTHVDKMIEHGQDCVFYWHAYAASRADKQAFLAHLKQRQDEGLCEVMLRHQWYEKRSRVESGKRSAT